MTDGLDPRIDAIERRLERLSGAEVPSSLRHRVLAAVDRGLAAPGPPRLAAGGEATVPGWAWAAAVSLGVALAIPVVARVVALRHREPSTLVARLRAAGVDDEPLVAALADAAGCGTAVDVDGQAAAAPSPNAALRAIDVRRITGENL